MDFLNGRALASRIEEQTRQEAAALGVVPKLGAILVGNDPGSRIYVNLKEKAAARIGVGFEKQIFPESVSREELLTLIQAWNSDVSIHGILLQLPLPEHLREATDELIAALDPQKDVDGFHPENTERFLRGDTKGIIPVFPAAIFELIASAQQSLLGRQAIVVCNSVRFGEMMVEMLRRHGIAADILLQEELVGRRDRLHEADIIVTACGIDRLLTGADFRSGAIVVDGGIVEFPDGSVAGDVDRLSVENIEGFLSPVPGGVGPVTVACLFRNLVRCTESLPKH